MSNQKKKSFLIFLIFQKESWSEELGATNKIKFISDPEAAFTKQIGAELDLTSAGFGIRSQRYSMIVEKVNKNKTKLTFSKGKSNFSESRSRWVSKNRCY